MEAHCPCLLAISAWAQAPYLTSLLFFPVVSVCDAHDTIHPAAQARNPELVINLSVPPTQHRRQKSIANGTGPFIASSCGNPGGGWSLLHCVCHMDTVSTVRGATVLTSLAQSAAPFKCGCQGQRWRKSEICGTRRIHHTVLALKMKGTVWQGRQAASKS